MSLRERPPVVSMMYEDEMESNVSEDVSVPQKFVLHEAVASGDVELLEKLVDTYGVNQMDSYGQTALHVAACEGMLVCARVLVRNHRYICILQVICPKIHISLDSCHICHCSPFLC